LTIIGAAILAFGIAVVVWENQQSSALDNARPCATSDFPYTTTCFSDLKANITSVGHDSTINADDVTFELITAPLSGHSVGAGFGGNTGLQDGMSGTVRMWNSTVISATFNARTLTSATYPRGSNVQVELYVLLFGLGGFCFVIGAIGTYRRIRQR
jgi:hypothetical protein